MKKLIILLMFCVFLVGCEQIFEMMGLHLRGLSYTISTDSVTYQIGSTVTITCVATNNNTYKKETITHDPRDPLFYYSIYRNNELIYTILPAPEEMVPDVIYTDEFEPGETKSETYTWTAISSSGVYTISYRGNSTDIEIFTQSWLDDGIEYLCPDCIINGNSELWECRNCMINITKYNLCYDCAKQLKECQLCRKKR